MRSAGLALLAIGFLAGALVAVLDKDAIDWAQFVPCLVVAAIGVTLIQLAARKEATSSERVATGVRTVEESLARIVEKVGKLDDEKESTDVYELPNLIDSQVTADVGIFADGRESVSHAYGVQAYADLMSEFAAGERYLNRVWSAAAEGYIDEAHTYLERARGRFADAHEKLQGLGKKRAA